MSRQKILIGLVWIIIALFFVYTWVARNSRHAGPLSPLQQAQTHQHPHVPKPARIDVRNYQYIKVDRYRFTILFTLVNTGEKPAEQIVIRVLPWVGGDYDPDKGMDVDPMDPIAKQGKDDYVQRLDPKQSIDRKLDFFQWPGYSPGHIGRLDHEVLVHFKEVDEPEPKLEPAKKP